MKVAIKEIRIKFHFLSYLTPDPQLSLHSLQDPLIGFLNLSNIVGHFKIPSWYVHVDVSVALSMYGNLQATGGLSFVRQSSSLKDSPEIRSSNFISDLSIYGA